MTTTVSSLDDRYSATEGRVFMSGLQALVRLPMAQMRRDRAAGLDTGALISGYRGSQLMEAAEHNVKAHLAKLLAEGRVQLEGDMLRPVD